MLKPLRIAVALGLAVVGARALASPLAITIEPAATNPSLPQMGDNLLFHSTIRNDEATTVDGVIAWLSLIEVDAGNEQPVDLEDWSAHKAATAARLKVGDTLETDWPIRLIKAGKYRVVISAASRDGKELSSSPFADFAVREKPVVESRRVLPVAFGMPLLLAIAMVWHRHRRRHFLR
jgi:hypothetical protein